MMPGSVEKPRVLSSARNNVMIFKRALFTSLSKTQFLAYILSGSHCRGRASQSGSSRVAEPPNIHSQDTACPNPTTTSFTHHQLSTRRNFTALSKLSNPATRHPWGTRTSSPQTPFACRPPSPRTCSTPCLGPRA